MITPSLAQSISGISLPKINLLKICIFWFILIASLVVFYIFQISEITKASFSIFAHGREIPALSQENKNLEARVFQEQSLANAEAISKNFNYEKVSNVYYIKVMDNEMAVKH